MKNIIAFAILLLPLVGSANTSEIDYPNLIGNSVANQQLQVDVINHSYNKISKQYNCSTLDKVTIEFIDAKKEKDHYKATELWTFDACNQSIPLIVEFIPDEEGGVLFSMTKEHEWRIDGHS